MKNLKKDLKHLLRNFQKIRKPIWSHYWNNRNNNNRKSDLLDIFTKNPKKLGVLFYYFFQNLTDKKSSERGVKLYPKERKREMIWENFYIAKGCLYLKRLRSIMLLKKRGETGERTELFTTWERTTNNLYTTLGLLFVLYITDLRYRRHRNFWKDKREQENSERHPKGCFFCTLLTSVKVFKNLFWGFLYPFNICEGL